MCNEKIVFYIICAVCLILADPIFCSGQTSVTGRYVYHQVETSSRRENAALPTRDSIAVVVENGGFFEEIIDSADVKVARPFYALLNGTFFTFFPTTGSCWATLYYREHFFSLEEVPKSSERFFATEDKDTVLGYVGTVYHSFPDAKGYFYKYLVADSLYLPTPMSLLIDGIPEHYYPLASPFCEFYGTGKIVLAIGYYKEDALVYRTELIAIEPLTNEKSLETLTQATTSHFKRIPGTPSNYAEEKRIWTRHLARMVVSGDY